MGAMRSRRVVGERLAVTTDLQYLINPALNPDESSICLFGLRARFVLRYNRNAIPSKEAIMITKTMKAATMTLMLAAASGAHNPSFLQIGRAHLLQTLVRPRQ